MTPETHDLTRLVLTAALPPTIAGIASLVTGIANNRRMRQSTRQAVVANEKADIANSKADLIAEKTDAIHEATNSLAGLRDELQASAARAMLHVATMQDDLSGLKLLVAGLVTMHDGAPDRCPFAKDTDATVTKHEATTAPAPVAAPEANRRSAPRPKPNNPPAE